MTSVAQIQSPTLEGFGTAESRWARFGAYYAMFPIDFVRQVVDSMSQSGDTVIDPFCGRGTVPYISMITGRQSVGCEINPVAWLYASAKTDPHPHESDLVRRLEEVRDAATLSDAEPENEFQSLAFGKKTLAFINSARRELRWQSNSVDRTLAAIMVHFLHAKIGQGLSNQLRHSRALAPLYSIRWWRNNGFETPPDIDPVGFLTKRINWRYHKGLPQRAGNEHATVLLGDAAATLPTLNASADLVLTSPPYCGVTNYRTDNWLRLWALNEGPAWVNWNSEHKFSAPLKYTEMLQKVVLATRSQAKPTAIWYIRIDAREQTKTILMEIMKDLLPNHSYVEQSAPYSRKTQTALYGDSRPKPGEVDVVFTP